jgi:hypothetical protein
MTRGELDDSIDDYGALGVRPMRINASSSLRQRGAQVIDDALLNLVVLAEPLVGTVQTRVVLRRFQVPKVIVVAVHVPLGTSDQ